MKYIWDLFYEGEAERRLVQAKEYSPYLEEAGSCLNGEYKAEESIPFHAAYRFPSVAAAFLEQDSLWEGHEKEKEVLFDVVFHYLFEMQMKCGITRKDILAAFLGRELMDGNYGNAAKECYIRLEKKEQTALCYLILRQQEAGNSLVLFQDAMKTFFRSAAIYKRRAERKQIFLYIGEEQSERVDSIVNGIRELFLPIGFQCRVFWENHFGITGFQETMKIGNIEIF